MKSGVAANGSLTVYVLSLVQKGNAKDVNNWIALHPIHAYYNLNCKYQH
jgi:hypothetical protein